MTIDFDKGNGLVPAIVQNQRTGAVLMLGYMNREALDKTNETGKVTFYSRSRGRLWTKGESSGNHLDFVSAKVDCDGDALLIQALPHGPT
ncbi:MAG: phosphoribosyl-ATP pyrophosphohydrolase/phosphoribosyl-AMP cyclohydrolase, partial [Rhodothermales bacterium]